MTITGTSHFVSFDAAVKYYAEYHYDNPKEAVIRKISEGEIHVVKPDVKPGERVIVIDSGQRYGIES